MDVLFKADLSETNKMRMIIKANGNDDMVRIVTDIFFGSLKDIQIRYEDFMYYWVLCHASNPFLFACLVTCLISIWLCKSANCKLSCYMVELETRLKDMEARQGRISFCNPIIFIFMYSFSEKNSWCWVNVTLQIRERFIFWLLHNKCGCSLTSLVNLMVITNSNIK